MSEHADGEELYALAAKLYPMQRSLTGAGVRETFDLLSEYLPLRVCEVATGTPAFDWAVPKEWAVSDGYIADEAGKKIISYKTNPLHVMGYSAPIDAVVSLEELQEHLHSLEGQPEAIPYVTSYYKERWGFCLTHTQRNALKKGAYRVYIDSTLKEGSLTYAELVVPGKRTEEILLSTYVCHPSLANDNCSGIALATFLARWIMSESRNYTYRVVFIPETIGSLVYLSKHMDEMKKRTRAGFVLTCVGDDRCYSFLPSRDGATLADRVAQHVLAAREPGYIAYTYLDRGSDERQYCSPGVDLPVVSIMRTKYGMYPEYHTSLDDLSVISPQGLAGSFAVHKECIGALEHNKIYKTTCVGEPQLGKRGLYPTVSKKGTVGDAQLYLDILAYADGTRDLIDIAKALRVSVSHLFEPIAALEAVQLLKSLD